MATKKKYLSEEEIRAAFVEYLKTVQNCQSWDADFLAKEFPDPYGEAGCFLHEEYVGDTVIDGKKCEVRECCTDFSMTRTFNNEKPFKYYKYIFKDGMGGTVGEYRAAPKLYQVFKRRKNFNG